MKIIIKKLQSELPKKLLEWTLLGKFHLLSSLGITIILNLLDIHHHLKFILEILV